MRVALLLTLTILAGCANTVSRLPGPVETPGGAASGECESAQFLTLGKTRYQTPMSSEGRSLARKDDGTGVYGVGETQPKSVSELEEQVGSSPMFDRHREGYRTHDRDRWIAAGLGVGAAAALTVGTILLVGAFGTETKTNPNGSREEEQVVSGGQLAAGGIVLGAGFGLGIGGVAVAPSAAERANADAARYVYRAPQDDLGELRSRVGRNNDKARERCAAPKR